MNRQACFYAFLVLMTWTCDCSPVINRDDRILGGRYAEHGEWPSTVAVSFSPGRSSCGSNILTPSTLLTACHCVMEMKELEELTCLKNGSYWNTRLVAGSISRNPYDFQGFQVRFVFHWVSWMQECTWINDEPIHFLGISLVWPWEVIYIHDIRAAANIYFFRIPHPNCARSDESGEWLFDIAVIILNEPLIFNELVKPIKLPHNKEVFKKIIEKWQDEEKACQVAGWGFTAAKVVGFGVEEALNASEVLKVLDMKLLTQDECLDYLCQWESRVSRYACKQRYRHHGYDRVCAVPRYSNNGSICGGDSGGPLKCDDYVIGVVSYGTRCSDFSAPIVFSRVDVSMPFLLKYMKNPPFGRSSAISLLPDLLRALAAILCGIINR